LGEERSSDFVLLGFDVELKTGHWFFRGGGGRLESRCSGTCLLLKERS